MLQDMLHYLYAQQLLRPTDRLLLAVSGGIDSVVMAHLFLQTDYEIGVAHCNFQLRGKASEADEVWLRQWCAERKVPFYHTAFATERLAKERKTSIQETARILRYDWLEKIRQQAHYQVIATAHHLNDAVETFFYNFAKGTGLKGLQGIPVQNGKVIRPLLFATKPQIQAYASDHHLTYREDVSNAEDKYMRNKIRHHVLPIMEAINPDFLQTAAGNFQRLHEAYYWYRQAIFTQEQRIFTACGGEIHLSIAALRVHQAGALSFLYEHLRGYGFHPHQLQQALEHAWREDGVGARFETNTHQLLVDRTSLIVRPLSTQTAPDSLSLPLEQQELALPDGQLRWQLHDGRPTQISRSTQEAWIDADGIELPLKLRHWQPGDHFYPLGMDGHRQKLQDFFSNQKLNRFAKDRVWLLTDATDRILWVVGWRLDERCKITEETQRYLIFTFLPPESAAFTPL